MTHTIYESALSRGALKVHSISKRGVLKVSRSQSKVVMCYWIFPLPALGLHCCCSAKGCSCHCCCPSFRHLAHWCCYECSCLLLLLQPLLPLLFLLASRYWYHGIRMLTKCVTQWV